MRLMLSKVLCYQSRDQGPNLAYKWRKIYHSGHERAHSVKGGHSTIETLQLS